MNICNLGSLNIDYVYAVDHFVQPGETLAAAHRAQFAGGKGLNQSIALAKAGAPVFHAGRIGPEGGFLVEALSQAGADTSLIETAAVPTGHAVIQVDEGGQNCILLFGGANQTLDERFLDRVLAPFQPGDILLLQNEVNLLPRIIEKAYEKGLRIALNPSPIDDSLLRLPLHKIRWLILNEIEGRALTGRTDPEEIVSALLERAPESGVMLTLGHDGALYGENGLRLRQPIFPVKAVDTTAAGDTFTGYFLAGILQGLPMEEVLRRASRASSIAVSRQGAAPSIPTLEEVLSAE